MQSRACLFALAAFTGALRLALSGAQGEAPRKPRRLEQIARGAGKREGPSKGNAMELPWWQLEEEAERLMAPRMPFRVEQVSPPPVKKLGYALLDARRRDQASRRTTPQTSRGDVINVKGNDKYVVSKVRFLYDLVGGRYRLRSKVLEVQTPRRYKINEQLADLVPHERQ
ncbi:unnamed protein product [Effrenium voratum]|uniref:Uncharacterized protein n=1 Tax=Effrenium voratum TaxID=2562239 RepID=A0AA36IAT9_9DINO|nr:unnamed protein product [Effrenium voratum]CAJ1431153.1 unnamed protein product [Effrenium voratum]